MQEEVSQSRFNLSPYTGKLRDTGGFHSANLLLELWRPLTAEISVLCLCHMPSGRRRKDKKGPCEVLFCLRCIKNGKGHKGGKCSSQGEREMSIKLLSGTHVGSESEASPCWQGLGACGDTPTPSNAASWEDFQKRFTLSCTGREASTWVLSGAFSQDLLLKE
ncbi:hypothetical protein Y1Q_0007836 [Alligator mississippiensis]|uniref:Uncharacterized protein n=1 Tax=Alligator mississippiensis TaxID=8496 RepID=A0A151N745_ALLMI|nr:hypothetical protein Y1Q_0007836 [Alligator mississippiensis]